MKKTIFIVSVCLVLSFVVNVCAVNLSEYDCRH
jgi:hypothetical protein